MNFNIISAICKHNNGIGFKGKLPWSHKEDLKHFSKITKGKGNNAIIMGKNTWISIHQKPLPSRHNIVLSTTLNSHDLSFSNLSIFNNIDKSINFCKEKKFDEVWIIGGETIYKHFLNISPEIITKCIITEINDIYKCDTFFPILDNSWTCQQKQFIKNAEIITYTR